MHWLAAPCGALIVFCFAFDTTTSAAPPKRGGDFFENRIRPMLVERCVECHGPSKQESGLRLDSRDAMLKGGDSGPAIVVGKPEDSLLIEAVRRERLEMPPDEELPVEEVAALEQWIRTGAVWPGGAMPSAEIALGDQTRLFREAKTHWAFQPVKQPPLPEVTHTDWVRTHIDRFILEKLEAQGIEPGPLADRRTLIRRLSFDLIGLPPSEQEVLDFQHDASSDAVAKVVDRLLASPHYGERWGRHWLDVARYADMRDFIAAGNDRRYPYAYTYRDWVIKAFNDDMPYDEFVRQQLAADFYATDPHSPQLAALGLLMVGPRFIQNTNELIADRIDVVGRGFLGLAVTCARCHDHKYDPIPTADYYALYGVFASCEEPKELPTLAGMSPPPEKVAEYEAAMREKQAELDKYGEELRDRGLADFRKRPIDYLVSYYEMNVEKSDSIRGVIDKRKVDECAMTPLVDNLDRYRRDATWHSDPVWGPLLSLLPPVDKSFNPRLNLMIKTGMVGVKDQQPINEVLLAALRDSRPADKRSLLEMYGRVFELAEKAWQKAIKESKGKKPQALKDAALEQLRQALYANDGPLAFTPTQAIDGSRLFGDARRKLGKYEGALKEVESTHPGAPARAFMLVDKEKPVEPSIFIRGDQSRKGDRVTRHFLSVLDPEHRAFTKGSGRQELAEDIADAKNPLTARVFVNRVWMHHFGVGLVDTPGDFGFRSNPPSHPELLDWLAAKFIENGWSIKKLHRMIVLSSAYRQQSRYVAAYAEKDPENRLLWSAHRRRLDFEAMRDAMLAVTGQLDETLGGRAVALSDQPFTKRRTVYGLVDRLNLDPIFSIFDFASPDVSTPERAETTIPQQALFGMNHPFVIEQARAMCSLPEIAAAKDDGDRLRVLYGRVYRRKPSPVEMKVARTFLVEAEKKQRESHVQPTWQYGYGPADPSVPADERFEPLMVFDAASYQVSEVYPDPKAGHVRLNKNGGHPGRSLANAVIRRWCAPHDGFVEITGTLQHLSDKGDGVRARIMGPGNRVLGEWTALNEKVDTHVKRVRVTRGQTIDFIVDPIKTNVSDGFNWAPRLAAIAAPDGAASTGDAWDARNDFAGPPPPPLGPWEQLAQALLLTNEFMFLD